MNWTTTSITLVIGALIIAWILVGLIVWKACNDRDYVIGWFGVSGVFLIGTVIALICICQAQTDQIRASKCRKDIAPAVLQAHPDWSVQESRDFIAKVCP